MPFDQPRLPKTLRVAQLIEHGGTLTTERLRPHRDGQAEGICNHAGDQRGNRVTQATSQLNERPAPDGASFPFFGC